MNKIKNVFLYIGLILPIVLFGLIIISNTLIETKKPRFNYLYLTSDFNFQVSCKEYIKIENDKIVFFKAESILSETNTQKLLCGSKLYFHDVSKNISTLIQPTTIDSYKLVKPFNEFNYYSPKSDPDGYKFDNYYGNRTIFLLTLGFGNNNYSENKVLINNGYFVTQNTVDESINFFKFC